MTAPFNSSEKIIFTFQTGFFSSLWQEKEEMATLQETLLETAQPTASSNMTQNKQIQRA